MKMLSRSRAHLRRLWRHEGGGTLVLLGLSLPLLLGFAGLAVDVAQWVFVKRDIQEAADAAAIAGVYSVFQEQDVEFGVDASLSRSNLPRGRSVSVERSPDGFAKDPFAVRVRIAAPAQLTFAGMFLEQAPIINAEATASVVDTGKLCALALASEAEAGLLIEPNTTVEAECRFATNSFSSKSVQIEGGSTIQANRIITRGIRQNDPLENTEPPLVPNTGCPNVTINPGAAAFGKHGSVLEPGCYGNMILNGLVTLQDGEYILNRGSFLVGATGEVKCRACSIFLTSDSASSDPGSIGKIQIQPEAKVQMAAPTRGPNADILFYQDRHAAGDFDKFPNLIGGNSFSELKGTIYVPSETVRVDGSFGPNLDCARFIGRRLVFRGRVLISSGCSPESVIRFNSTEVRLIG